MADAGNEMTEPVALRGVNTDMTAKPKRAKPVRTAAAPVALHPRAIHTKPRPKAVAHNVPEPERKPPVNQASQSRAAAADAHGLFGAARPESRLAGRSAAGGAGRLVRGALGRPALNRLSLAGAREL